MDNYSFDFNAKDCNKMYFLRRSFGSFFFHYKVTVPRKMYNTRQKAVYNDDEIYRYYML